MNAAGHHSVSSSLLDIAMEGVIATHTDALGHLMEQMEEFSAGIGRDNAEAIKAAAAAARVTKKAPEKNVSTPEPTFEPAPEPAYEPEPQVEPPAAVVESPPACSNWSYYPSCLAKCEGVPGGFPVCAARCQENLEVDVGPCTPD
jgi:hypothetical protein